LHTKGKVIKPELTGTNKALARDVERRLLGFRYPSAGTTAVDRINMLKNDFMPLLFEIEKRPFDPQDESGNGALRSSLFEWSDALLFELQIEQSAHERGACLEALSSVMESSCLSEQALLRNQRDRVRFTKMMMRIIEYVMGKLGAKGVFHNTLLFSGRTLVSFPSDPHHQGTCSLTNLGIRVLPDSARWRTASDGLATAQRCHDALHPECYGWTAHAVGLTARHSMMARY
jgi:hypothetical protein